MARLLTITRSPLLAFGTRKRALARPFTVGRRALSVILVLLFCLFSLLYLLQTNAAASLGADIDRLETERTVLREAHKALELKASELSSLRTIERSASSLRLTKAPVRYVDMPTRTKVASR